MSNSTQNDEIKQIEKAYGGCRKCYGKGYSTVRYGHKYSADFEGDKTYVDPIKTNIHPCDCDRGKQIEILLADARKEVITELEDWADATDEKPCACNKYGICEFNDGWNKAIFFLEEYLATLREEEGSNV